MGEYAAVSKDKYYVAVVTMMVFFILYIVTENGLETMGRILIYWLVCYIPWLVLETFTVLPDLAEENIDYYEDPMRILPNLAILLTAFFFMKFLWKRKVLHWIPEKVCEIFTVGVCAQSCIMYLSFVSAGPTLLQECLKVLSPILGVILISVGITLFYSTRRKRKINIAIQCHRKFYHQICMIQREAGKFRHDLSNHLQILSVYDSQQRIEERNRYERKLEARKKNLEIKPYSGQIMMDFILNQIREMAEENGQNLIICWNAERVTEEEILYITDQCLECLVKWYREKSRWSFVKIRNQYQIDIKRELSSRSIKLYVKRSR